MAHLLALLEDEFERVRSLAEYNLDYSSLHEVFNDLAELARLATGTQMSYVNLMDAYYVWVVAVQGATIGCVVQENTVCRHTIIGNIELEVKDLSKDARFCNLPSVKERHLKYYYGIPLKTVEGYNIGSLCVIDTATMALSAAQIEMLRLIAKEVIRRLDCFKQFEQLRNRQQVLVNERKMLAHDIRGPLIGIIGLADLMIGQEPGLDNQDAEEYATLIKRSGSSVLEMANEILNEKEGNQLFDDQTTLVKIRDKLTNLFSARTKDKGLLFTVVLSEHTSLIPFLKNKIQQILGNLVSNAIKFTPEGGKITVNLDLSLENQQWQLHLTVTDTGIGMDEKTVNNVLYGSVVSSQGTKGEIGYGLGLELVKQLVQEGGGELHLVSEKQFGTTFTVRMPVLTFE